MPEPRKPPSRKPARRPPLKGQPPLPDERSGPRTSTWLGPLVALASVALAVLVIGELFDGGRGLLAALRRPDPSIGSNTLGNVGQVVAQVLGVAISVVAIIVELAANRYTHRLTELFFRARINFIVMGLFVISGMQALWVSFTYTQSYVPSAATFLSMILMSISVLALLPYFAYVSAFVKPLNVLHRIRSETQELIERGPRRDTVEKSEQVQHSAADGVAQLSDIAMNSMVNQEKGISMAAVNTLADLMLEYLEGKSALKKDWFLVGAEVSGNPDFISLTDSARSEIEKNRTWFEFLILRQYEALYRGAVNNYREICYLLATNTRRLAEAALLRGDEPTFDVAIKFFNTYLRATINNHDVRTAYNVLNQYRLLAEWSLHHGAARVAVTIANYFKYYGQLAFSMDLGFILETTAYDLCTLNELAFDLHIPERTALLHVFLQVDKESEGVEKEAALRGVRKAQVKLAAYYLFHGDESAAREIYRDMANEQAARLTSIREELMAVDSPHFWEITDRGTNFDWMPPECRSRVLEFFSWFGEKLPPHVDAPPVVAPTFRKD